MLMYLHKLIVIGHQKAPEKIWPLWYARSAFNPRLSISALLVPGKHVVFHVSKSTSQTLRVLVRDLGANNWRFPRSMIKFYIEVRYFLPNTQHADLSLDFTLLDDSQTTLYRCRPTAKPEHLRKRDKLKSECYQRATHLKLMPHVFTLAQSNSTTLRNRKDADGNPFTEILWKIDWKFEPNETTLSDTCVSESKTLRELIDRFFDNTWKLGPTRHLFVDSITSIDQLDIFLINFQKSQIRMNPDVSLRESLRDQAILEYPTFVIQARVVEATSDSVENVSV